MTALGTSSAPRPTAGDDLLLDHGVPLGATVTVQGPGGSGKTVLLAALARAHRAAGTPVVDLRALPLPGDVRGDLAVLVDDAHRLTAADAQRVSALAGVPGVRVALAARPWPRPPALLELLEVLRAGTDAPRTVVLGHAGRALVTRWAEEQLGATATAALVEFVLRQTGGLPALVHPLLSSLGSRRPPGSVRPIRAPGRPARIEIPAEVTARVASGLASLGEDARALLHLLAAGAPLDTDILGEALGASARRTADLVAAVRASGFLLASGAVVPLVRGAVLAEAPADVTRGARRQLMGLLLDRGDQPVELARALVSDGVRDLRAGRLLEEQGTAALREDPALAGALLDLAARAGIPAGALLARRAEAAALVGDHDTALQHADAALHDPAAADRERAAAVAAAVLAQRGFLTRSIGLYRAGGHEHAGNLALVLLAAGARDAAQSALDAREQAATGLPTLLSGATALAAHGVLTSLGTGSSDVVVTGSLSTLARSISLLEPVGRTALMPDTPAALSALVALHAGEFAMAESVLSRALTTELGGRPARPRHLLLLGWTAMLRGRLPAARTHLAEARAAAEPAFEPRDELCARALEMGVARRSSDPAEMRACWDAAREALLRHPVDLFSLLPLGELIVGAAKLDVLGQLAPYRSAAAALLARLGNPHVWTTALHWSGLQAAVLAGDPAKLGPHASALVTAAPASPLAAALAQAGRAWLRVITDDIDAQQVIAAAEAMAAVGLTWDGSRLAAQAATRSSVSRDRTLLLQCARWMADEETAGTPPAGPVPDMETPSAGLLSQREREVAELIVAGQTYREVGGRLFISAKTVEHHVSRIRHRLGASNRSDLLARLRAELSVGA